MWAIQIVESIKATGSEPDLLVRWAGDQARMIGAEQELGACDALLIALPGLLSTLTTILVLGLGGRQVMLGALSIGSLVAFQTLLIGFNQPFRDLARLGSDMQELRADLDRIAAWPARLVKNGDDVSGVLMPLIPNSFFEDRVLPSGARASWWIMPTVPTRWRSSGVGGSGVASRWATRATSRLPRMTSSMSRSERGWSTASGNAVSGKTTASRSGRTGSASGIVKSAGLSGDASAITWPHAWEA